MTPAEHLGADYARALERLHDLEVRRVPGALVRIARRRVEELARQVEAVTVPAPPPQDPAEGPSRKSGPRARARKTP